MLVALQLPNMSSICHRCSRLTRSQTKHFDFNHVCFEECTILLLSNVVFQFQVDGPNINQYLDKVDMSAQLFVTRMDS